MAPNLYIRERKEKKTRESQGRVETDDEADQKKTAAQLANKSLARSKYYSCRYTTCKDV
jgi:hypothetical protein